MEKQFNIQESFIVKIKQNIDQQEENLDPKDRKFFNLDIIMDHARLSQKYSYNCEKCQSNKDELLQMSSTISEKINTIEGRREITKMIDQISNHLRKEHKMYIRRYMSSLYTIFILLIGLLGGVIAGYFFENMKVSILIGGALGLFFGSLIGSIKEKILIKKEQVYGKF